MEQIRIIKEMRENDKANGRTNEHIRPRYMVWENVPGAFSSNKGEDFRCVLEETARVADKDAVIPKSQGGKWTPSGCILGDGWSIAWRVHDAQFWGVPQRRKRICLLADFDGDSAGKILFELEREADGGSFEQTVANTGNVTRPEIQSIGESVPRNFEPGTAQGEGTPDNPSGCADASSWTLKIRGGVERDSSGRKAGKGPLVQTEMSATLGVSQDQTLIVLNDQGGSQMSVSDDVTGTLRAQEHGHQPVVYGISAYDSNSMKSGNPHSGIYEADTSRTLDLNGGSPACNQGGMAVVCLEGNGSRESHKGDGYRESETMYTLNTIEHHAVCIENHPNDSRVKIREDGMVQTLSSRMGTGGGNVPMVMEPVCIGNGQVDQLRTSEKVGALNCMHDQQAVVTYGLDRASYNQGKNAKFGFSIDEELVGAQTAKGPGAVCHSVVRRLTPLECTRLQGYPDGWVDIGDWVDSKGKKHKDADSPKYKALGNSIALPFWEWLAARMRPYFRESPTMASLFDGIGGFPLVFSRCGFKPVWASEIEEFPMAVTKIRFPED